MRVAIVHRVAPVAAFAVIGALPVQYRVGPVIAKDRIVAIAGDQPVIAEPADKDVIPGAGDDAVVPRHAKDLTQYQTGRRAISVIAAAQLNSEITDPVAPTRMQLLLPVT